MEAETKAIFSTRLDGIGDSYKLRLDRKTVDQLKAIKQVVNSRTFHFPMSALIRAAVREFHAQVLDAAAEAGPKRAENILRLQVKINAARRGE